MKEDECRVTEMWHGHAQGESRGQNCGTAANLIQPKVVSLNLHEEPTPVIQVRSLYRLTNC